MARHNRLFHPSRVPNKATGKKATAAKKKVTFIRETSPADGENEELTNPQPRKRDEMIRRFRFGLVVGIFYFRSTKFW